MTRRIAGVSLLLLLAALVINSTQDDLRPRVEELLHELQAEFATRPTSREPAGGPAQEGLAWASYWEASKLLKARPEGQLIGIGRDAIAASEAGPEQRRAESVRLAALIDVELALIREGARRRNISPLQPDDKESIQNRVLYLRDTQAVINLMGLLGVAELESGNDAEGVATLLDAMQIAQDYMHAPTLINQMIGASEVVPKSLLLLLTNEGLSLFTPEALAALELGVASLIASAPTRPDFLGELEFLGRIAVEDPTLAIGPQPDFVDRFLGNSGTIAEEFIRAYRQARSLEGTSPRDALIALQAANRDRTSGPYLTGPWTSTQQSHRCAIVRLRMLHHALRLARGLEPAVFKDPFEMPLVVTESEDAWHLEVGETLRAFSIELSFHR